MMKQNYKTFAKSYERVGIETEVNSASPERLISMLYAGARAAIAKAKLYMQMKDIPNRGKMISKAIEIIDEGLKSSVNESVGEIAKYLLTSYDLMIYHLLQANLKADETHLDVVDKMLSDIAEAWNIATGQAAPMEKS